MTMCTNIATLLKETAPCIENSDSARLDTEILLCHAMQCSRTKIYSHPENIVNEDTLTTFRSLIKKRQQGYPVAYLTGKKEFWSLELSVNEHTLIPRPETESLVHTALQMIPQDEAWNILDLGTGSGAIAIAIASERPNCTIIATDIDTNTLQVAQHNIATHQLPNIKCLHSDWYRNLPQQAFDMIVSNPPYIKQQDAHLLCDGIKFEPRRALLAGIDGMQMINQILRDSKNYLAVGAYLLLEHGSEQKTPVTQAFLHNGFSQITTLKDLSHHHRISYGYRALPQNLSLHPQQNNH